MLFRLLRILTISSTCIYLIACTSTTPSVTQTPLPSPIAITTPMKTSEWETRLPDNRGAVKIIFTLPQQAVAEFQFLNGKSSKSNMAVARVLLSNKNCTSGHSTTISYKINSSDYLLKYFEKEAPWNNTNTVILAWDINNQLTITMNDETTSIEVAKQVNTLKIASYLTQIEIHKIEYLAQ